jgi:hypothetical protein
MTWSSRRRPPSGSSRTSLAACRTARNETYLHKRLLSVQVGVAVTFGNELPLARKADYALNDKISVAFLMELNNTGKELVRHSLA